MSFLHDNKSVNNKSLQHQRGCGDVFKALNSKFSIYKFATIGADGKAHGSSFHLLIVFPLVGKISASQENSSRSMMCFMDMVVLFLRPVSSLSSFSMIFNAGWMGTEVKSALTS